MAERLSLVLRALIFQADRHPGIPARAHLARGLELRVTHSTTTQNYKLECGRARGTASENELLVVASNWPARSHLMEWHPTQNPDEEGITWAHTIVQPCQQEAPREA